MKGFVLKKYKEFFEEKGYIPLMFNPYNCTEIMDIAPCVTTKCGGTGSSAAVLIIEREVLKK